MEKNAKIFVAGHRGLVGSALIKRLSAAGFTNLISRDKKQLDLMDEQQVTAFFQQVQPDYVFLAAAKVGGIGANASLPADFIYQNLKIELNVIHQAYLHKVKKLLFLGSSCIYPKEAPQPIHESSLLGGYLEETNKPYAIAKIAGLSLCEAYHKQYGVNFISLMPTNLYGENDNFHPTQSHVLPALLRRFYEHNQQKLPNLTLWGSGKPRREFLHADDLADAAIFLMQNYDQPAIVNVGWGKDISIYELALEIQKVSGYQGQLVWDRSKPDGTMQKLLDTTKLTALGWTPKISLEQGIQRTYAWLVEHYQAIEKLYRL